MLYQNKYRLEFTRLRNWDYGSPGLYLITICTKNKIPFFGEILNGGMECADEEMYVGVETQNFASLQTKLQPTKIGIIARQYWNDIPCHFPFVQLDEFILMPDHMHGILKFNKPGYAKWDRNTFGPQSQNLASVIRGYKAGVKRYATQNNIPFAWQSRYYDQIIGTTPELIAARYYIKNNPIKWLTNRSST